MEAKEDIDFKTEILQEGRAVLAIMTRDISFAYYIVAEDFIWEAPPVPPPIAGEPSQLPPAPTGPKPKPVTLFQGKENEIFFSSKSHQRTLTDSPEDEMHFVTYQLQGKELVRGESSRAVSVHDREDQTKFHTFTLLEDVRSIKFSYYDMKSEKWVDQWDTEKSDNLDRLPGAVKIDIEYMPDYDQNRTRRTIAIEKISSAVRITETSLKVRVQSATPVKGQSMITVVETSVAKNASNKKGVALLLVIMTTALMAVISAEIGFASRVDLLIGQNARNRTQAYYLSLSAAKLSLLRLHMYYKIKNLAAGAGAGVIPANMVDRIWSLPLPEFPLPGTPTTWPGKMSAIIESEGSKIPINLLDAHNYRHSSEEKQTEVVNQIKALFTSLFEDEDFDKAYRGLDVQELINNIVDWVDPNNEKIGGGDEEGDYNSQDVRYYPRNDRMPTLSELHMVKGWTDDLYKRIAGNFSVLNLETTVNANYITTQRLKAIDPKLTQDDLNQVVKRRLTTPFTNLQDMETFITTSPDIKNGRDFKLPADFKDSTAETVFIIEASGQVGDKALRRLRLGVKIPQKALPAPTVPPPPTPPTAELLPPVVITVEESI